MSFTQIETGGCAQAATAAAQWSALRSMVLIFAATTVLSGCDPHSDTPTGRDGQGYIVSDIVLETANQ